MTFCIICCPIRSFVYLTNSAEDATLGQFLSRAALNCFPSHTLVALSWLKNSGHYTRVEKNITTNQQIFKRNFLHLFIPPPQKKLSKYFLPSSSSHADRIDFIDSLSPSIPIIHHLWQVLPNYILTELI